MTHNLYRNIIILPFVLILFACEPDLYGGKTESLMVKNKLEGTWQAEWQLQNQDLSGSMQGTWQISDQWIEMKAFGYPGCPLGSDTLVNTLAWQYAGGTFIMRDPEGDLRLVYHVIEENRNEIRLGFLEDIEVTLKKSP